LVSHETASSSAECSRDKPPFSFVRGQDSTMCQCTAGNQQHHFMPHNTPLIWAACYSTYSPLYTVSAGSLTNRHVFIKYCSTVVSDHGFKSYLTR